MQAIRFHDLRHTADAIMLSNSVPIFTASKIIGYARPSITSDTYGHLIPGAAS
jgi:integrase